MCQDLTFPVFSMMTYFYVAVYFMMSMLDLTTSLTVHGFDAFDSIGA